MTAKRKTFVLRCDKPRYDGGVELDLERYFGRQLQPNANELQKAKQALLQRYLKEQQLQRTPEAADKEKAPVEKEVTKAQPVEDSCCDSSSTVETKAEKAACPMENFVSDGLKAPKQIATSILAVSFLSVTAIMFAATRNHVLLDNVWSLSKYSVAQLKEGLQALYFGPIHSLQQVS